MRIDRGIYMYRWIYRYVTNEIYKIVSNEIYRHKYIDINRSELIDGVISMCRPSGYHGSIPGYHEAGN
jgi:hypothetical protein